MAEAANDKHGVQRRAVIAHVHHGLARQLFLSRHPQAHTEDAHKPGKGDADGACRVVRGMLRRAAWEKHGCHQNEEQVQKAQRDEKSNENGKGLYRVW